MTEKNGNAQWGLTATAGVATFLTSLCLTPTISEGKWSLSLLLVIANVAVVGGLDRKWSVPKFLIPVLQFGVLFLTTILLFAPTQTFHGVPTPSAVGHLLTLSSDAFSAIWNEQPPLVATDAVVFVVTAGVGLIAIAVDALAVTWRRPILAGLPLFVLYLVPAAVLPDGVPWPLFALSGAGWIVLQLVDGRDRLAHWGRVVGATGQVTTSSAALSSTGRRLGVTALVAAIAIPMVVPSIGEGVFGAGGDDGDGTGRHGTKAEPKTKVITVNPIVDLKRDLTRGADDDVFSYFTTDTTPQYWRIATLDQFDGFTWTLAESSASSDQQASAGLPPPPGLAEDVPRTVIISDVDVTSLNSKRLPLPYPASSVDIEGDWRWDSDTLDVFSAEEGGNSLGMNYVVESLDVAPTAAQLEAAPEPGADMDYYLQVPPDIQNVLGSTTAGVTAGAVTDYAKAESIQNWFRTDFKYSLAQARGNDTSDLAAFLRDKSGYCEQFAATMALMARVAEIPSRVQVGFTPGSHEVDGMWQVTAHDAHAWPELWFEGVGWVRFEPTPGGGDGNVTPAWAPGPVTIDNSGANPSPGSNATNPSHLRRDAGTGPTDLKERALAAIDRSASAVGSDPATTVPGPNRKLFVLMLFVLGLLVAAAPVVTKAWVRNRRWHHVKNEGDAVVAAWTDVLEAATDVDLAPQPTETPRDLAGRLPLAGGLGATAREEWLKLSRAVERYRYARVGLDSADTAQHNEVGHIDAWRERSKALTASLYQSVSPADRRKAVWWPASGRQQLSRSWNHLMDVMGACWQSVTAGMFRRLRRST